MNICILSMQRVQNYGSLLQSYALKKVLEEMGHTVFFLDIERNEADDRLRQGGTQLFADEGPQRGLFGKLKKLDRYSVNRIRIKMRSKQQEKIMDMFRTNVLGLCEDSNNSRYDCCVIGSDEVFNCLSDAKWGFTSQLFGNVKQANRIITYAASGGATTLELVPAAVASRIRNAFKSVSAFSVRDKNTYNMVSALTDKQVFEHLDPVLIEGFEVELSAMKKPDNLPEKYCVVYSYYNRIHSSEEIKAIKKFCKEHEMEIVSVGAPQMWIKKHLVLEPFEVLRVFIDAAFVITDTFHGTIFSAKYADRFATITRKSNQNKLGDLIGRLGIEKHWIQSMEQLEVAYVEQNDKARIADMCEQERVRSIRYLRKNL